MGDARSLDAGPHPQLGQDARHVMAGGLAADVERLTDLRVRVAGGEQPQHLELARRQPERCECGLGGARASPARAGRSARSGPGERGPRSPGGAAGPRAVWRWLGRRSARRRHGRGRRGRPARPRLRGTARTRSDTDPPGCARDLRPYATRRVPSVPPPGLPLPHRAPGGRASSLADTPRRRPGLAGRVSAPRRIGPTRPRPVPRSGRVERGRPVLDRPRSAVRGRRA